MLLEVRLLRGPVPCEQRHHGADTGGRHQAPAHLIIPDDGQQAAMQDAELLAKRPSDNEQRFVPKRRDVRL